MILKSIKWRLQIWYGVFLALVLLAFGSTSYQLERDRQHRQIVDDFDSHLRTVLDSMRTPPPFPERGPDEQMPEDQPPPDRRPPARPPRGLHPSPRTTQLFNESAATGFYYVIWFPDGEELMRSTNTPPDFTAPPRPGVEQMRGSFREFATPVPGPHPEFVILVGRSIVPELKELHRAALKLAALGLYLLLLGLAGGWWIAGRAIRPIKDISATAVKISAGDLSQRISADETESELGQLAAVLNATFVRLEAAFARQQQFTSDAAHELRTPVSVILTQTQSTLTRERSAAEYRDTLESCQRAAQRMRRLIESLLALARLDAGQEPVARAPFDLAGTAKDCLEMIRPLADERRIKIVAELNSAPCGGDADRVTLVITNLLTNAIHYNRDGGEVRIATRLENGAAVLTVSDNGPGIAAEHLPHIFDRFYRADAARTSSQGRAGLGLAICKAIVEAHGGTIGGASQPGGGATFTVRLPAENPR